MKQSFLKSRYGLAIQTILVAAAIYALGFEMGSSDLSDKLAQCQAELAEQVDKNVRITQERNDLERSLEKALKLPVPRSVDPRQEQAATRGEKESDAVEASGLLHMNRAAVLLDGRLVLTLEEIGGRPRRALIGFRAAGRQGRKALAAGQEIAINVEGRHHRLLVRQITTASVLYQLIPAN
jgi:hypothetical protein